MSPNAPASSAADTARESARQGDGRFGSYALPASSTPPPPPAALVAMAPDGTELEPGFVLRRTEWGPRIHGPTGMELQVGYSGAVSTLQDVELPPAPWGAKRSLRYRRTPNELRIDVEPRGSGDAGEFPELVADLAAADTEIRAVHHRHTAETAFCKHPNATYSEPENTGRAHGHAVYEWALNCPDCGVVETHGADSSG